MTSISSNIKSLILGSGRASFHCGQRVAESYYPRLIANPFGPIKCNKLYEKYTVMINDMTPLLHYHRKTSEIPCSINLISINSGHNAITLRRWRKGKKNDTVWFGVVLCCLTAFMLITSSTCQKILSYLPFIAGNQCALNEIGTVDAKNPTIKRPFFLLVIDYGKWVSM